MAWFNKKKPEEIPEKYRNLSEDELLAALTKGEGSEAELAKIKDDLKIREEEASGTKSELEAAKARLAALDAANNNNNRQSNGNESNQQGPISFMDDEDAAFAQRAAPLANIALQSGALTAKMSAQQQLARKSAKAGELSDAAIFDKYESEVDKLMESVSLDKRIYPQSWLQAFAMVKGNHLNEIVAAARSGDNTFFSEVAGGSTPPPPEKKDDKLTPEEEHVAKRMKITPEQYMKQKKSIQVIT